MRRKARDQGRVCGRPGMLSMRRYGVRDPGLRWHRPGVERCRYGVARRARGRREGRRGRFLVAGVACLLCRGVSAPAAATASRARAVCVGLCILAAPITQSRPNPASKACTGRVARAWGTHLLRCPPCSAARYHSGELGTLPQSGRERCTSHRTLPEHRRPWLVLRGRPRICVTPPAVCEGMCGRSMAVQRGR